MSDHLAHSHNQHARPDGQMGRTAEHEGTRFKSALKRTANARRRRRDREESSDR